MSVTALIGTDKGGFILRSDKKRAKWDIQGPVFKGWKVTTASRAPDGRVFAATASQVYGPALHTSTDLKNWTQIDQPPAWPEGSERKLNQIWTLNLTGPRFWAGVDEAGLFTSDDQGKTWSPVPGLNEHPTRPKWFPGAGGLCAHAILLDKKNPQRAWVGISAVGVFRTDDGGQSWHPKNKLVDQVIEDKDFKDIGYCVHGMVADPDNADVIYRREHVGMYRTDDGGDSWRKIENGLPSRFGFPIVMDRKTKSLHLVPLESDEYRIPKEGALEVYRTDDGGKAWKSSSNGLPRKMSYGGVLRGAMAADQLDPCGIYFGTTSGHLYASANCGESWSELPGVLPRILCVSILDAN